MALPFFIRRIWLIVRGARVDRDNPRLAHLESIDHPERFVWAILPHAARSFGPSILMLPKNEARAAAVAYLYARMLDTYEDLSTTPSAARDAMLRFAARFDSETLLPAPSPPRPPDPDGRDLTHLLLIEKCDLVDQVFLTLDPSIQERVVGLIREMAQGMGVFSSVFENQGGVLHDEEQVLDYCRQVIGLPALFVMSLVLDDLSDAQRQDALQVSELIQLANITRDIEKDLQAGVAYHPSLRPHLGSRSEGVVAAVILAARRDLTRLAIQRTPSFRRLVGGAGLPRVSSARAAAVLMMLFADRHYRSYPMWPESSVPVAPRRVFSMVMESLPAMFSSRWADRVLARVERELLATV